MNPFSVVSYCQQNLPSLPSLPSALLQRRTSSNVVPVVVQTSSPSVKGSATSESSSHKQPPTSAPGPLPPHASSPSPPKFSEDRDRQLQSSLEEKDNEEERIEIAKVNKPRNNPQAILPEMEGNCTDSTDFVGSPGGTAQQQQPSASAREKEQRALRRHSSFPMVQARVLLEESDVIPKRASFDSFERSRALQSVSTEGSVKAATMVSQPRPLHLRHLRTFSSPSILPPASSLTDKPLAVTTALPNIPAVCPMVDQAHGDESETETVAEPEAEEEGETEEEEGEEEEEEKEVDVIVQASREIQSGTIRGLEVSEAPLPPIVPPSSLFSTPPPSPSRPEPAMTPTPVAAPAPVVIPPSPIVSAPVASAVASAVAVPSVTYVSPPRPVVKPASAASTASSFLASWQGRSRAMIPNIPRPSPLMPFRAARSVVHQVTAAGTGMIPSKAQLGAIPVAGRLMKHPVMDSTLDYIANKATERGISLGGLTSGVQDRRKLILPEDIHYRKLNKTLIHQAMTLSVLAVQKEELSKAIDDEAGDDAFELYLAAISTLLHALPCKLHLLFFWSDSILERLLFLDLVELTNNLCYCIAYSRNV